MFLVPATHFAFIHLVFAVHQAISSPALVVQFRATAGFNQMAVANNSHSYSDANADGTSTDLDGDVPAVHNVPVVRSIAFAGSQDIVLAGCQDIVLAGLQDYID